MDDNLTDIKEEKDFNTKQKSEDVDEFCQCTEFSGVDVDTDSDSFGYWTICKKCKKRVDFHYYNHYDGEDHDDIYLESNKQ